MDTEMENKRLIEGERQRFEKMNGLKSEKT